MTLPRLFAACLLIAVVAFTSQAAAQETVFNVASGDVLDRGKLYSELDFTYKPATAAASFTPRVVIGVGHRIEAGVNLNGIGTPGPLQTAPTPTVKWKAYDGGKNGWAFLLGDDVFIPAQNRTYTAGNYVYGEFTKSWRTKTRATFGAYDFTGHVVASANRVGGQFAIEQPVGNRLTLAADWFTGHHALGFITPGLMVKITPKLTWYASYQLGNRGVLEANHQLLIELGWNLN